MAKGARETSETPDGAADGDTRIAADPVAVVLAAMAVLGVVASIAAVNWMAEERSPDRARTKRKAGAAVKDLERCCVGLKELFKRLHQQLDTFSDCRTIHDRMAFDILAKKTFYTEGRSALKTCEAMLAWIEEQGGFGRSLHYSSQYVISL